MKIFIESIKRCAICCWRLLEILPFGVLCRDNRFRYRSVKTAILVQIVIEEISLGFGIVFHKTHVFPILEFVFLILFYFFELGIATEIIRIHQLDRQAGRAQNCLYPEK